MRTTRFLAAAILAIAGTLLPAAESAAQTVAATVPAGSNPRAIAVNPFTNKVYIASEFTNAVLVLDGATHAMQSIPVGTRPQYIALNPLTNKVYVTSGTDTTITVIDGESDTVTATLAVGSNGPIAINPYTNKIYIVRQSTVATDEVTILDGNANTWFSVAIDSFQPNAIAVDPRTDVVYVSTYGTGDVRALDGSTTDDFPHPPAVAVWSHPVALAANPVTNKVYVVTEDSRGPIGVIDGGTLAYRYYTSPLAQAPKAVAVNPVTNKIYAAFDGQVMVMDGATESFTFIPSGTSGAGPVALGINASTNRIYAPNADGTLTVIDGATNATTTLSIPAGAAGIGVNPLTNTSYVIAPDSVSVVSGSPADTVQDVPVHATIAPLSGDASDPDPVFSIDAASAFAPFAPAVDRVWYQLDGVAGAWSAASGSGPYSAAFTGLAPGTHTLYAVATDSQEAPSVNAGPQSVPLVGTIASYTFTVSGTTPARVDPSIAFSATPNPSTRGQSVQLTATLSGTAGTPTGNVTFYDATASIAGCTAVPLSGGAASCSTSALAVGTHSLTAQYTGDASYNPASSSAVNATVNPATPSVALASTPNPSAEGDAVSISAAVSGSAGTPVGTISFMDGGTAIAGCESVPLASGSASCEVDALGAGSHSLTAAYSGDSNYASATSAPHTQSVASPARADPSVALSSSPNPSTAGQSVALTAGVSGGAGTPTGTITFLDGGNPIAGCANVALAAGNASCTTASLAAGNHSLAAQYSGDGAYNAGVSSVLVQAVQSPESGVALAASASALQEGGPVTLSATVTGDATAPTGTVTFMDGESALARCTDVPLASGSASCVVTILGSGTHAMSVQYSGDANYPAARSAAVGLAIRPAVQFKRLDFDGDGRHDLVWQSGDGSIGAWLMNGLTPIAKGMLLGASPGALSLRAADLDGDGKTDFVRQLADGSVDAYLVDGLAIRAWTTILPAGTGATLVDTGDFDGDGHADLVWRDADGAVELWLMDALSPRERATIMGPGSGWSVSKVADFDGDGKEDLLWTGPGGAAGIWLMNGTSALARATVLAAGSGMAFTQVGDFNGDGKADLLWTAQDGSVGIWLMSGIVPIAQQSIMPAGSGWAVTQVADFNRDGNADLVWAARDGSVGQWLMSGTLAISRQVLLSGGSGWSVTQLGDLDGNGTADMLWTHASGDVGAWLMNGAHAAARAGILPGNAGWALASFVERN
jgi:DNA-binding beta-propeller fold protein YncE